MGKAQDSKDKLKEDSLQGSSVAIGMMQRRLARPLRKDQDAIARAETLKAGRNSISN